MIKVIILFLVISLGTLSAQTIIDFTVKGISDSKKDGAQKDRQEAIMDAKRQALEKAGLKIESRTSVENFQTIYDLIESQAAAVILPGSQIIDIGYLEDGTFAVMITGKLKVVEKSDLSKELIAQSVALLNEVLQREPDEQTTYWWAVFEQNNRKEKLELSVLLAVEAFKRSPNDEAKDVLQNGLALLNKPFTTLSHDDDIREILVSPDGKFIISAGGDYAIIWDFVKNKEISLLENGSSIYDMDYSPDGKFLATASIEDCTMCIWDFPAGKEIARKKYNYGVSSVSFSPNGKYLLAACRSDTIVYIYEQPEFNEARKITIKKGAGDVHIRGVSISPDSRYLAIISGTESHYISDNNFVRMWDIETGEQVQTFIHEKKKQNDNRPIYSTTFSHNSQYLATGCIDGTNRIWDLTTGEEKYRLRSSCGRELCFTPDDKKLISTCGDITVWNYIDQETEDITMDVARISNVKLSPDGKYLAASSEDKTVRVWNLKDKQEIIRIITGGDRDPVCFSADNKVLICCTGRETIGFYDLFPEDLVKEAGKRLSRNLTPEEWHNYLGDEPYKRTFPELP
jgi:WD40 repeat protein